MTTETPKVQAKAFYKTRRFWGIIIMAFGLWTPGASLIEQYGITEDSLLNLVDAVTQAVGAAVFFWGSIRAKAPVGIKDGKKV